MNGTKAPSYARIGFLLFVNIFALHIFSSCALLPLPKAKDIEDRNLPLFEASDVYSPEEEPLFQKEMGGIEQRERMERGNSLVYMEEEIRKLNRKVQSLEAKIAVLEERRSMERVAGEQPIIEAEETFVQETPVRTQHSALQKQYPKEQITTSGEDYNAEVLAPAPKTLYPEEKGENFAESSFQEAMSLYERGSYVEAKDRFFGFYKKYPKHVLASHALYWAGKASEQKKAWRDAIHYWMLLEAEYSFRSIYMPEVWEGLSKAFMILGDRKKAKKYKELLQGVFPQSPKTTANYNSMGSSHKR